MSGHQEGPGILIIFPAVICAFKNEIGKLIRIQVSALVKAPDPGVDQNEPPAPVFKNRADLCIAEIIQNIQLLIPGQSAELIRGHPPAVLQPVIIVHKIIRCQMLFPVILCDFHSQFLQSAQHHVIVISDEISHIWPHHHILQHLHRLRSSVRSIPQHIELVRGRKTKPAEQLLVFFITTMYV